MAQHLRDIFTRRWRVAAILAAAFAGACLTGTSFALTHAELYQATAPVTDRSDAAQAVAFQRALKTVLVRVTGRRSAGEDPALAPLIGSARRYVQQFRPAADGQVWVSFDGAAIERWLTQNNQPLWGHERPSTFVWLTLPSGAALVADDPSELKSTIDMAALERGITLLWPTAADVQKYATGAPADLGHRLGADAVLTGHATNLTATAVVRWTLQYQDRSSDFAGVAEGVNRAADTYAGLFAASGAVVPVEIDVTGVADLKAFAALETYLDTVTSISHVSVQSMSGDIARFKLSTRGGNEALQHTLALGGRLLPVTAGEDGLQRFQLRR